MSLFFFFNDTATTEIYTLSLHDALPICNRAATLPRPSAQRSALQGARPARALSAPAHVHADTARSSGAARHARPAADRKSTRLNSSHGYISYAVFCLKKKKTSMHL